MFSLQQLGKVCLDEGSSETGCGLKLVLQGIGAIEDLGADELSDLKKMIHRKTETV